MHSHAAGGSLRHYACRRFLTARSSIICRYFSDPTAGNKELNRGIAPQQTQNICMTLVKSWSNVEDVVQTLIGSDSFNTSFAATAVI